MYAITGITGKVGGVAARTLLSAGQRVRAVVRDADKGRFWSDLGCEVAIEEMEDAEALTRAFTHVTGVFILPPSNFDPEPGSRRPRRSSPRGGDALAVRVNHLLQDSLGDRGESYVELAIRAVRATVNGMVVVALFDGVLIGITYALAGVQRAEVWGAVTGLFAMVPFLGYVAVAGVTLALAARGAVSAALVISALGFLVLFAGDKIVRPMLVGGAIRLVFVWVLMASLGGLELLGLLGLFVGPVVLALGGALWDDWTKNRGRSRVTRVDAALSEHA